MTVVLDTQSTSSYSTPKHDTGWFIYNSTEAFIPHFGDLDKRKRSGAEKEPKHNHLKIRTNIQELYDLFN